MSHRHTYQVQVVSDDIDLHDHVNNLVYLKWMQDAAVSHSVAQGWDRNRYDQLGCSWVVRAHKIEYRFPSFLGDQIEVYTWIDSFRRASCVRKYEIMRVSDQKVLAVAETNWAFLDFKRRMPVQVPTEIVECFLPQELPSSEAE